MVSVIAHAVFVVVAVVFVAVKVYIKPEQTFEVKQIKRPNMKLRKLQVPVKEQKKTQAPKLRHNIVTKPRLKDVAIKMPEVIGVPGGTYGRGDGLGGLGFHFDMDLFGGDQSFGNELVGTFYDLKQWSDGSPVKMDIPKYISTIRGFVGRGWKSHILDEFYHVPKKKYAIALMMPTMGAEEAPKAFGVADLVKPSYWVIHYKGQFRAPEKGSYRFCGLADNVLIVRVGKKVVLDASLPKSGGTVSTRGVISDGWDSDDENSGRYPLCNGPMAIGDWIPLRKGQSMPIEILVGEIPGGHFSCQLLIQKQGESYRQVHSKEGKNTSGGYEWKGGERPVLPIFKLAEIPDGLLSQMKINPDEATAEGPVFGVVTAND